MTISFDRVAEIYDESRSIPSDAKKRIVEILVGELKGFKKVLDAGVGTGRYAKPLQDNGFDVVGLDVASRMLRKAAEKGTGGLLRGDVCSLPFRDSSFDVTLSAGVLHLIKDWKKTLQEITSVTEDLLVSVVHRNPNPLSEAYTSLLKRFGYTFHKRGISEWELKGIVKPMKSILGPSWKISIDEHLPHLNQKAYSYQWGIPQNFHKQVMRELKNRFTGGNFYQEVEILIWDINTLETFLQKNKPTKHFLVRTE